MTLRRRKEASVQFEIEVGQGGGFCQIRIIGRMEPSAFEPMMHTVLDHPGFRRGMPVLYDVRAADLSHLRADDLRAVQAVNTRLAERRGEARVGILVPDAVHFGLARMYEVLGASANLSTRVFDDYDKALQWVQASSLARRDTSEPR